MNAGYFLKGLSDGLMAARANQQRQDSTAAERLGLEREKFEYLQKQGQIAQDAAALKRADEAAQKVQNNNLRNFYKAKAAGLMPELKETDFPFGTYKAIYEDHIGRQDAIDDNANFAKVTGLMIPSGASLSDDLLKTTVDYMKHKNPNLTGDFANLSMLFPKAQPDELLNRVVQLNQAKSIKNTTNINNLENYEEKKLFDLDVGGYEKVTGAGDEAKKRLANIQSLRSIPLDTDGDPLVLFKNTLKKYAGSFGVPVDMDEIANIDMAVAKTNRMALDNLAEFKGATSERELQFSKEIAPQISQPKAAREWLMDTEEAKAMYDIEKAQFYAEYRAKHNSIKGVKQEWDKYKENMPTPYGTTPKGKKPITWYKWRRAVIEAHLQKGLKVPSEAEMIKEWESTHAVH